MIANTVVRRVLPLVLIAYAVCMFVGTHLPPNLSKLPGWHLDKLIHFFGYFGLGVLVAATYATRRRDFPTASALVLLACLAAYAMFDELTQALVGRGPSVWDWAADLLGSASGLLATRGWLRRRAEISPTGQ